MKLRRWSVWLGLMALLVAATWGCWQIGLAAKGRAQTEAAVQYAALTHANAMYAVQSAYTWELGPPPD